MTAEVPFRDAPSRRVQTGRARALLLDPNARELLDRVIRLAGLALRSPVAALGVPEFGRLQIVSEVGLPEPWRELGYLPLDASYSRHVVQSGAAFVVEDTARHPVAYSVPRLENFPRAAYCGTPLKVAGDVVAVLFVCDAEPRRWTPQDVTALRELGGSLLHELETVTARLDQIGPLETPLSLTHLPESMLAVDADWRFIFVSEHASDLLGRSIPELTGRSFWELFPGLVGSTFQEDVTRAFTDRVTVEREEYCRSLRRWLEVRAYPLPAGGAALQLRDVTVRRRAQEELRDRETRYRRIFQDSRAPLFVMAADGRFTEINHALEELLGRPRDAVVGRTLSELGADPHAVERLLHELVEEKFVADIELTLRRGDDAEIVCVINASANTGEDGLAFHGSFRDVTEQRAAEAELVRSALQDPLTALPNRLVFMDRLERLIKQAQRRTGYRFAVIFLDLDNFKTINDSLGHLAGDKLLVAVARRLEECLRQGDTVARIGGDEFAVLLDDVTDIASVTWVVDRIRDELSVPFADARHAGATASIGIAISGGAYEKAEDLLRDADEAMYRAKASGRNTYVIFDSGMHERALAQRQLEEDLRTAMDRQQLALHYQPVIELNGGAVTGLEALVRWTHPERGILLPDEFIPIAEQTGLIIEIGWWVLREACRQLRAWQRDYPDATFRLTMSVNLSAKQFVHPQLIAKIDEILGETELAPQCLRLDLTEAVVMQNARLATQLLDQLRDRGIRICLDDFGTGFSSIRQLRQFPISTLKIDRSFVGRVNEESDSREIVQTIIALGRSMAIDAVAEGVETPEQLEQLRRLGTRFAQGFLFSLPLDSRATSRLLQNEMARR